MGLMVGYLPGLSMRKTADLTPGNTNTDAHDAAVIAETAHTLRAISTSDEDTACLSMPTGSRPGPRPSGQPDHGPHPRPVCTQTPPWRKSRTPGSNTTQPLKSIATWPTPTALHARPDRTGQTPSPRPTAPDPHHQDGHHHQRPARPVRRGPQHRPPASSSHPRHANSSPCTP